MKKTIKETNVEITGLKKYWFHTKYFFKSSMGKKTVIGVSLLSFATLLITPMIINSISNVPYAITPYKRDANSGTSVAFEEMFLDYDPENGDKYGYNTAEVKSNDTMTQAVTQVNYSIGYVSFASLPTSIIEDTTTTDGDPKYSNDDFSVLEIGIDLDEDGTIQENEWLSVDEADYPARNLNVFWRGDSNTFEEDDITQIQLVYGDDPTTTTIENVWYWENLYNSDIWNNPENSYEEAINWALYNFISYGQSAWEIASVEFSYLLPETGYTLPTNDYLSGAPDSVFTQYLEVVTTNYGTQGEFDLFTIGSTSVGATSGGLLNTQIEYFKTEIAQPIGITYRHQPDHIGSGDAMQSGTSSKYEAYLGFQSKEGKKSDANNYYSKEGYNQELTDEQWDLVYNPFVEDVLVVIANPVSLDECKAGIPQEGLRDVYLSNTQYSWSTLMDRYESDYVNLNTCS